MVCMADEIKRRYKNDIGLETRIGKESLETLDKSNEVRVFTETTRRSESIREGIPFNSLEVNSKSNL